MTIKKVRNVLFDLDGTLADTALDLAFALNTVLEERDREPLPLEIIKPSVSLGGIAMIRMAFGIDEDHAEFNEIRFRFLELYSNNIARHTTLFDGMDVVLARLESWRRGWGVVTNKTTRLTEPLMAALGLSHRTPCIVCGDTVEHSKPHPAPMLHACRLLQCDPGDTVFVGDAWRDIEAGNRADMITLIAGYGYIEDGEDTAGWGATGIVDTPLEILDWVRKG